MLIIPFSLKLKDCDYEIDLIHTDKLRNKYMTKVRGKGTKVEIIENKKIEQFLLHIRECQFNLTIFLHHQRLML